MWIDDDGTVYLYYYGDEGRLIHIVFIIQFYSQVIVLQRDESKFALWFDS